jgi:hypothetical protein
MALTINTAEDYDSLPYRSLSYALSSPERMAALAQLFGMSPAPPHQARVLELGLRLGRQSYSAGGDFATGAVGGHRDPDRAAAGGAGQ